MNSLGRALNYLILHVFLYKYKRELRDHFVCAIECSINNST